MKLKLVCLRTKIPDGRVSDGGGLHVRRTAGKAINASQMMDQLLQSRLSCHL